MTEQAKRGPVGAALVGYGWWGQKMASVLQSVPEAMKLVYLVDPKPALAETAEAQGMGFSTKLEEALADPRVEAVILATPHAVHERQLALAAAAGKHVFCEKPLALTAAGAAQAVKLCREAGLVLGMGHERRFEPPIAEILELADAGKLGRLLQIEANFSHDRFLNLGPGNWRIDAEQAPAGGMTATGIHLLDLAIRLMGPAESVHCACESLVSELPQGDTVSALVRFVGGGTAYVSASLSNPFISRFAVFGSKGWIEVRDKAHVATPEGWVVTKGMSDAPITVEDLPPAEAVRDNLVAFAHAVRGEVAYPITGEQLVQDIALLEALFRSAKSGRIETVAG
ncbi:MAG: Gfo/Idh/MocA family oxidoreductase [Rhodospirillales bacterium]